MCGRFTIAVVIGLYDRFRTRTPPFGIQPRYNIAPSQDVPVIVQSEENPADRDMMLMKWGLVPSWAADTKAGYRMINARADSLIFKPSFRYNVQHHRCLVPATGFFEWRREGTKRIPYHIHRKDGSLFAFAGIFDTWRGAGTPSLNTFTIVTTEPNRLVAPLHDRMPTILTIGNEERWIRKGSVTTENLVDMLAPYPAQDLEVYRVSSLVNTPDYESAEVIQRIKEELL